MIIDLRDENSSPVYKFVEDEYYDEVSSVLTANYCAYCNFPLANVISFVYTYLKFLMLCYLGSKFMSFISGFDFCFGFHLLIAGYYEICNLSFGCMI